MSSRNIEYKTPAIEAFYREHRTRWDQFYESERVVFTRLGPNASTRVLDIGCGCGGLGLALRERFGVADYTGVEINRRAADTAKTLNPAARFVCADILAVAPEELTEQSFDIVVSLGCIDWNVEFADMLARAYRYVKPGGYFVSSFRLTTGASVMDVRRSYQYINFEGKREGEIAPYVVINTDRLLAQVSALQPARIVGFGYWGAPSPTAVTPFAKVCFAVIAAHRGATPGKDMVTELELPLDLLSATDPRWRR